MCGLPIVPSLGRLHPYALELDELVPVSKGGSAVDPANVRASHRCCNQWRGNKSVAAVRSAAEAAATVGRWKSPAEFVVFARSAGRGALRVGRKGASVKPSRRW